jgi:hypothetical protein
VPRIPRGHAKVCTVFVIVIGIVILYDVVCVVVKDTPHSSPAVLVSWMIF